MIFFSNDTNKGSLFKFWNLGIIQLGLTDFLKN